MSVPTEDQFRGCLLGLACGDALGQPVEAFPPDRIREQFGVVREFMAGDQRLPMPLQAGQWTDDTQMALDIARSILRCGHVDPADIAREFLADHETQGIRFSGFGVTYALKRLKAGIPWDRSGLADDEAQGNGAAMRVAPVAMLDWSEPKRLSEDTRLASVITHRHPEAVAGATATAYLIARALASDLSRRSLLDAAELIGQCRVAENLRFAFDLVESGAEAEDALQRLGTTGWVVHTVASAAFCVLKTPADFEQAVISAVMGGNDADTTGAIAGSISGALNGAAAIPARWRDNVEAAEHIGQLADGLWRLSGPAAT